MITTADNELSNGVERYFHSSVVFHLYLSAILIIVMYYLLFLFEKSYLFWKYFVMYCFKKSWKLDSLHICYAWHTDVLLTKTLLRHIQSVHNLTLPTHVSPKHTPSPTFSNVVKSCARLTIASKKQESSARFFSLLLNPLCLGCL